MYDIIGDIHGHAKVLVKLLSELGYKSNKGLYKHPERKAIFVGDLINRGPDSREVLQIVRPMVEAKTALAILGNHELNLMAFYTLDDYNKPLLSHSIRNIMQLFPVFESFKNAEAELHEYIDWFYSLPLFIEMEDIRIVHACWQQDSIDYIRKNFYQKRMNREHMIRVYSSKGPEAKSIYTIIKGPDVPLPRNKNKVDADSIRRGFIRVKWWEDYKGKTYKQISTQKKVKLPKYKIPNNLINMNMHYPEQEVPVFIGHYSLNGKPRLLKHNICCLDYSVVKFEKITAYRWNGEAKLSSKNFVQV